MKGSISRVWCPAATISAIAIAVTFLSLAPMRLCAFELGICAHVNGGEEYELREREFAMMRDAGIKRVRCDFTWAATEPKAGEWNFERLDNVVSDAERYGLRILPILDYGPNQNAYRGTAWENLDAWLRYAKTVVARYKGKLDVVEVWNEEDINWKPRVDPAQYAAFFKATSIAIKEIDPSVRVMMGGTAGGHVETIEAIYKANAGQYMDIANIHHYSWPARPDGALDSTIRSVRKVMERHGDAKKPLWITENGWPTHDAKYGGGAHVLLTALSIARPGHKLWRLVRAKLTEDESADDEAAGLASILPPGSTGEAWGPRRIASELSTAKADVVMLPSKESFPLDAIDAIIDFMAQGGVVVSFGLTPLYYAYRDGKSVPFDRAELLRRFHISWGACWTNKNLPISTRAFPTDEALSHGYKPDPAGYRVERFFSTANLAPGDRMVPLLVGEDKNGNSVVGEAVYLFDSDLKGAFVASCREPFSRGGVSEAEQAACLLRAIEIAEAEGVEAYFPYEFRSHEKDPLYSEHHFGIVHRDLKPKPAYEAIKRRFGACVSGRIQ